MNLPLLRTVVEIPESEKKITYSSKLMFIGSCFTENIGQKLEYFLFNVDINPFGVIYNPESVANSLEILLQRRLFSEADLVQRGNTWVSFYHHSRFSSTSKEEALEMINSRIEQSYEFLKKADFLFITFGTAWVYVWNETGQIVSNCHKFPQKLFTRRRLEVEEIVERYKELLPKIWQFNKDLQVVFTVSPVRHWKDGAVGNQVSKATLIVAIHKLLEIFPQLQYFPAYEIVMDELRDYRFYDTDMIHIGEQGVNYIWLRFKQTYFTEEIEGALKEVEKVVKAYQHKPRNKKSNEYYQFVNWAIEQIMLLKKKNPQINIDHILSHFTNELKLLENE